MNNKDLEDYLQRYDNIEELYAEIKELQEDLEELIQVQNAWLMAKMSGLDVSDNVRNLIHLDVKDLKYTRQDKAVKAIKLKKFIKEIIKSNGKVI